MQKTEQNYGTTSNETQSFGISEGEEKEIPNLTENYISKNYNGNTKSVAPTNGRYRNLEKSKMPNFIKEAMINNPIEIPETPYHTFELDDVVDLMDKNEYKVIGSLSYKHLKEFTELYSNNIFIIQKLNN